MDTIRVPKAAVVAAATAFAVLLLAVFWWKLNPAWSGDRKYYRDAARLQAEEANMPADGNVPAGTPRPGVPADKIYQPESGN